MTSIIAGARGGAIAAMLLEGIFIRPSSDSDSPALMMGAERRHAEVDHDGLARRNELGDMAGHGLVHDHPLGDHARSPDRVRRREQ